MYKNHTVCRACGATDLEPVFDLGPQPLTNDFASPGGAHKGWVPLKVLFCPHCTLAQLSATVEPRVLYSDYPYVTSASQTMYRHFDRLLTTIKEEQSALSILEIGSNDGRLLKYLQERGASKVYGIDPAANLVQVANAQNQVPTLCGVFDRYSAGEAKEFHRPGFDVIIARHVFCHVDDWRDFIENLGVPSKQDTLVCIEVPYAKDLLDNCEYDTIYHEHTSYLTVKSIEALLKNSAWKLQRIVRLSIHGGALLLMLRRKDFPSTPHESVFEVLNKENIDLDSWRQFAAGVTRNINNLRAAVRSYRAKGMKFAGYGASAKSAVIINACGFTSQDIDYIIDNTPHKIGRLSPGSDIPIIADGQLEERRPDYVICFAWNFFGEIFEKEKAYNELGGKWILPHPEVRVVDYQQWKSGCKMV